MLAPSRIVVERVLASPRLTVPLLLGAAILAAVALSACGRNGGLEVPPGPAGVQPTSSALNAPPSVPPSQAPTPSDPYAAPGTPQDTIAKTGFDSQGNPAATPGQKRPFILDPLLR